MAADAATLLRVRILVLANVVLQLADGYVTLLGTSRGFGEGNPIVAAAMTSMGPANGLLLTKLIAIGILGWLYRHGPRPLVVPGLVSVAVSYTIFAVLPWTMLLVGPPPG